MGYEAAEAILPEPNVKPMDITGKAMRGWAMVAPGGFEDDTVLERFVGIAIDFVATLLVK